MTASLTERFHAAQRAARQDEGDVPAKLRLDRLQRCIDLLVAGQRELCDALASDFGQRPASVTRAMDILPAVLALRHAHRNVRRWMRPRRRSMGIPLVLLPGARARIEYRPLGVIGIVSPWNIPVGLSFGPLAGALAAGNRCLLKPSEITPATSEWLRARIGASFDATEICVVTGGPDVGANFCALPFDHLLFTGSTAVGRRVMTAAAEHLVPVTLELGGKCPVVIGRSANIDSAIERILLHKLANAGQVCLAPDHVYLPREWLGSFTEAARAWVERVYPGLPDNPDYTSIVNGAHYARLEALLADATATGARVVPLAGPGDARCRERRLFPPALIVDARDDSRILREEIFGPLLPLRPYDEIDEAIAAIETLPRPLALYYFGTDGDERREVLQRTTSGGVTVNDITMHYLAAELPFGGVGHSGMGAYHGEYGFECFSLARAVFEQSRVHYTGLTGLRPPYGKRLKAGLDALIRS